MPAREPGPVVGRRQVLGWSLAFSAGAVTGLTGCTAAPESDSVDPSHCVARDSLTAHRSLAEAPLIYEISGNRNAFRFDADFYRQLSGWAKDLDGTLGGGPDRFRTYGTWTDGGTACDSWHNAGRAFDLAAIRLRGGRTISCRYDRWQDEAAVAGRLHDYWRLAASLHARFAYVLTYLYDANHANHIHVDNGRSGTAAPTFSARSRVQVQAVQAIATHVWQTPTEISGTWDRTARKAARAVLDRAGVDDDLDSGSGWVDFMTASARRG